MNVNIHMNLHYFNVITICFEFVSCVKYIWNTKNTNVWQKGCQPATAVSVCKLTINEYKKENAKVYFVLYLPSLLYKYAIYFFLLYINRYYRFLWLSLGLDFFGRSNGRCLGRCVNLVSFLLFVLCFVFFFFHHDIRFKQSSTNVSVVCLHYRLPPPSKILLLCFFPKTPQRKQKVNKEL